MNEPVAKLVIQGLALMAPQTLPQSVDGVYERRDVQVRWIVQRGATLYSEEEQNEAAL